MSDSLDLWAGTGALQLVIHSMREWTLGSLVVVIGPVDMLVARAGMLLGVVVRSQLAEWLEDPCEPFTPRGAAATTWIMKDRLLILAVGSDRATATSAVVLPAEVALLRQAI
jgi:hypothetical protein